MNRSGKITVEELNRFRAGYLFGELKLLQELAADFMLKLDSAIHLAEAMRIAEPGRVEHLAVALAEKTEELHGTAGKIARTAMNSHRIASDATEAFMEPVRKVFERIREASQTMPPRQSFRGSSTGASKHE